MLIESNNEPLDDSSPCPINGKYHNIPMGDVPSHFLDWFRGQAHLIRKYPKVMEYITSRKKAINQDLEHQDDAWDNRNNFDDDDLSAWGDNFDRGL